MGPIIFHLTFPVNDLEETMRFYVEGLGGSLGRTSSNAVTIGLGGHQLVAHLTEEKQVRPRKIYPRHFGLIFDKLEDWMALLERARSSKLQFYREPSRRFEGTRIEHSSFFLEDPSHNLLEFKHYKLKTAIFGEVNFGRVGEID